MLQTQAPGQLGKGGGQRSEFDERVKMFRGGAMIAMGIFAGAVLGGIVGLFVYANTRTPDVAHDGIFAIIQIAGVALGLVMGLIAARSYESQEQLIDASHRAGMTMLKKYKPKPGAQGQANVGQRVIGGAPNAGEEFLKTLLNNNPNPKPQ